MLVYLYDGTLEGLFCCVFESYKRREIPDMCCDEDHLQYALEQQLVHIKTIPARANRVWSGFISQCGEDAAMKVRDCFLSYEHDRASMLLRYMRLGFAHGKAVSGMLAHPDVLPVEKMYSHIGREQARFIQFLRFELMENGVYFARMQPVNNVLPLIMPHFADRYTDQPFVIYDPGHGIAGVYDLNGWYMAETGSINLPAAAESEREWKAMWRKFYGTVAIKERRNAKLMQQLCPKRYWVDMTEMPAIIKL
ncbi:MAG: TIGR03915 family putative DNA repair protein [Oscillospiraceae bacterium]|nr:TIGR03915 family putative DNA repair protein [Oscillospiraceae bacterium]